jgi:hypothetical protein
VFDEVITKRWPANLNPASLVVEPHVPAGAQNVQTASANVVNESAELVHERPKAEVSLISVCINLEDIANFYCLDSTVEEKEKCPRRHSSNVSPATLCNCGNHLSYKFQLLRPYTLSTFPHSRRAVTKTAICRTKHKLFRHSHLFPSGYPRRSTRFLSISTSHARVL